MNSTLMDTKYHEENLILTQDKVLVTMYYEIPLDRVIEDIPFKTISDVYYKRGGKHQPLTIGSLKRALQTLRISDPRI